MKFKFECCKFAWRLISRVKFATRNGFRITAFCELCEKFVCGLNSFHDLPPSPPADPTTFMMAQHGVWVMGREGSAKDEIKIGIQLHKKWVRRKASLKGVTTVGLESKKTSQGSQCTNCFYVGLSIFLPKTRYIFSFPMEKNLANCLQV